MIVILKTKYNNKIINNNYNNNKIKIITIVKINLYNNIIINNNNLFFLFLK